jgi:hypothetical protein
MWYLPVISRLRALFGNLEDSQLMSWHALVECKKEMSSYDTPSMASSGSISTPKFPKFGEEATNVRFALSTDGMNLFGDLNSSHSTWPVILTINNY